MNSTLCPPDLLKRIQATAIASDNTSQPPFAAFGHLATDGLLQVGLPEQPCDYNRPDTGRLLQLLKQVGTADLSVGRIYEGHLNALHLVHLYATPGQKQQWYADAFNGKVFGVWNTQDQEGISIHQVDENTYRLQGCKTFCSGAGLVQRPVVTGQLHAGDRNGWQMCIVSLEKATLLKTDPAFWQPLGMKASASYRLDFTGIVLTAADLLGPPGAYYRQPYFSGGAIRFAAVQLGGANAVFRETIQYLRQLDRTKDPFQQMRIGEMAWLIESGDQWLQQAGQKADQWPVEDAGKTVAYANMTRTAIEEICLRTMQLAERCVGARGLMQPGRLEQLHRDLTFYLRQPAPDAALTGIADYLLHQNTSDEPWN